MEYIKISFKTGVKLIVKRSRKNLMFLEQRHYQKVYSSFGVGEKDSGKHNLYNQGSKTKTNKKKEFREAFEVWCPYIKSQIDNFLNLIDLPTLDEKQNEMMTAELKKN